MSLIGLLGSLAGFIRVRYAGDKANIDNAVFRLHYRFTSAFFFGACVLLTAFDLIGNPIDCVSDNFAFPHVLNTYCWIQHTFTMPSLKGKVVGSEVSHPNIGLDTGERRVHSYYQWVPFVLFLQGILFYAPHWIWKELENGAVRNLTDGVRGFSVCNTDERKCRSSAVSEYLHETINSNTRYALSYIACEIINFANAVGNIFFIDKFLNGAFVEFGTRVIQISDMDQEERDDPLIEVFPRMTKCTFHKYGSSGSLEKHDALCLLALNIFNEKLYVFLWFWLVLLSIASAAALVYRAAMIVSPRIRLFMIQRRSKAMTPAAESVVARLSLGDYFLLMTLGKNLEGFLFDGLVDSLAHKMLTSGDDSKTNSLSKDSSSLEMAPILTKFAGVDR